MLRLYIVRGPARTVTGARRVEVAASSAEGAIAEAKQFWAVEHWAALEASPC